jgi:adenylate kinase
MTRGDLVPDEVVDQAVRERLEGLADERPAILDGYPRNVTQAERLHRTLGDLGRLEPPPAVVRLDVPREALLERLSRRREIEGRADDTDEGARRRLEVYDEETAPVPAAMAGWTDALEIEGDQPPDAVTEEILDRLHGGR